MPLKDPTEWIEDLNVFIDDQELAETAATVESTLVYGGSKGLAGVWIGLTGLAAGAFGAVTLSPAIRGSWLVFAGYVIGATVLLRGLHPLTKRLTGEAVAWLTMLAFFWASLLGLSAMLGSRTESTFWAYIISCGAGLFIGLMHGGLNPGVVRREDLWMVTSLLLAPVSTWFATYVVRNLLTDAGSLESAASAGAIAGGLFMLPMGLMLAAVWDEAHGLRRMGLLYLHNDNFAPKAVAYLDRAIAMSPADAELYNLRGIAWSKMGNSEQASADWRKVLELAPNDSEPHLNRGVDYLRRNALDEAVEALRTAIQINPSDARAHSNLGAAYERQGKRPDAIEHYTKAIEIKPDYANAYSNRAYAYHLQGDHRLALEDCDRAIELDSGHAMAHVNRGHALAALGRIQEADASYREALQLEPEPSIEEEAIRGLEHLPAERNVSI